MILGGAPVNDKVEALVIGLNAAGIKTVMSGDAYGAGLIYVDIDQSIISRLNQRHLPNDWKLTSNSLPRTKQDILGQQMSEAHRKQEMYLKQRNTPFPKIRLARPDTGAPVSKSEIKAIIRAFCL